MLKQLAIIAAAIPIALGGMAMPAGAATAPPLGQGALPATSIPGWQEPPGQGDSWYFDGVSNWWLVTCSTSRQVYDLNDVAYQDSGNPPLPGSAGSISYSVSLTSPAAIVGTRDSPGNDVLVDSGCLSENDLFDAARLYTRTTNGYQSVAGPQPRANGAPVLPGQPLPAPANSGTTPVTSGPSANSGSGTTTTTRPHKRARRGHGQRRSRGDCGECGFINGKNAAATNTTNGGGLPEWVLPVTIPVVVVAAVVVLLEIRRRRQGRRS